MKVALNRALVSSITTASKDPEQSKKVKKNILKDFFKNWSTKEIITYTANGIASASSLATFISGNFNVLNSSLQEKLESFSETLSKIAFSIVHVTGAVDLWQKKNFFPFIGYATAAPIAMLSSGYNLLVSTGLSGGLINFAIITDQREIVDDKGNPILDKDGNVQVINGDFRDRGWGNSLKTTLKESLKITRELYEKPSKIKKFTHAIFAASSFLIIGPLAGLLGFKKIEATIRNTASIAAEAALLFHKNIVNKSDSSEAKKTGDNYQNVTLLKSPIAQSGLLWICTAISDLLKRFDYFSDKVNNLTHLSLFFDRMASSRFTQGILNIKKDRN